MTWFRLPDWIQDWIGDLLREVWSNPVNAVSVIAVLLCLIVGFLIICHWIKAPVKAVKEFVAPGQGPRFRKRDKIAFVGHRVMRNAKGMASYIRGGRGQKRKAIAKFARRVFHLKGSPTESGSRRESVRRPELPDAFLEEDDFYPVERDSPLPEEVLYVLKNMRIFGHLRRGVFTDLLRIFETVRVPQNQYLFNIGDPDENMYIVQSGAINVYSNVTDKTETESTRCVTVKQVKPGEPIISLLSFLDYLSNRQAQTYKTVSARSVTESQVIKLSFKAFKNALDKYPESLFPVVQVIMVRLQRVTLMALHQYLGLGAELMNQQPKKSRLIADQEIINKNLPESHSQSPLSSSVEESFKSKRKSALNKEQKLKMAVQGFAEVLGVENEFELDDIIEIIDVSEGTVLTEEDTNEDVNLALVLSGTFIISQKSDGQSKEIFRVHKGGLVGQLQVLTGEPSFFTVTAKIVSSIAIISYGNVQRLLQKTPPLSVNLAMSVIDRLSPYVRSIDFALEWTLVESGKALYKQDDPAENTYVVLSGRLRSVIRRSDGKKELVAEYGRGELTGIVETLTESKRSTTVMAVRDTEVAKLPSGLLNSIKLRYPGVLLRLINLLGKKLQRTWETGVNKPAKDDSSSFSTVAVVALTDHVPLSAFTYELSYSASAIGPTLRITPEYIRTELGAGAFDQQNDFKLSNWLAHQEDQHRLVIFQCDGEDLTPWTKLCVRHADVILMLVYPDRDPELVTHFEERLESISKRTRKELVFLHPETADYPEGTSGWLRNRAWVNSHFHVKCPRRLSKKSSKVDDYYNKLIREGGQPDINSDFSRLARTLTGTSVGLVLGGGGARGCSHVGMIKSTLEAGIPIDRVAGVSIGAFIGALYCQERDMIKFTVKARNFADKMNSWWRQALDLTYPYTAIFTGQAFNNVIKEPFDDRDIEDLWLPFFTVTTDITDSSMRIHDYGSLWRYVRASMSLAGYLPPLCDPHDGHLLLDGGYTNNLPADVMRSKGARHILAIDVGAQDETDLTNYGDHLSGWKVVWRKWSPFSEALKVPDQTDVQSRLAYVSCVRQLECVKKSDYCDYIRPPIDKFQTLQFGSFDVIRDVGYEHGKIYYNSLLKAGQMQQFYWINSDRQTFNLPGALRRGSLESLNSITVGSAPSDNFNSLADIICRVREATPDHRSDIDEDEDDYDDDDRDMEEDDLQFTRDLTDEDSENLISDEDADTESGFLSQL